MFVYTVRILTRAQYGAAVAAMFFVLLSTGVARAQGGVGSSRGLPESAGGSHRIQGAVYLPDGRRAGPGIVVKLDGNVTGTRRAATDGSGEFAFNSLPASDYSLTIDAGADYEPLRQSVVIYGNTGNVGLGNSGDTTKIDVQLRPKAVPDAILFAGVPKEAVDSYKKAMESVHAGNRKKAVEELNGALTIQPNFALALRELGDQYLVLKEWDKVAEATEAYLKLKPEDAHAHLNLGIARYNQKKFDEAEAQLRDAVRLANKDAVAHYYLGMTFVSERKYADAQGELELAITNGGDNIALAHKFLGGLYMGSKNPKAADELEKYLKLDPKAPDAERIKGTIKDLRSKQQ
jgi:Tfp pilus assembly protein PilF